MLFDWLQKEHSQLSDSFPFSRPESGELNRVSIEQWKEMLEWVAQRVNDSGFPFQIASTVKPANMGLLGYIASCSANLGEAFLRLKQFDTLIYAVNQMYIEHRSGALALCWGKEKFRPGHWADSLAVAVLLAYSRQLTDIAINPLEVRFINPVPANKDEFESYFSCPVVFDAEQTEVLLKPEVLMLPMRAPDAVLQKILDGQASKLLHQMQQEESGVGRFVGVLGESIAAGVPTLAEVARRMNTSERTLQRQLKEKGTSFRDELEKARTEIARNLLREGELSLVDIASYLAYGDQAAFSNAFKRNTGQTPARYRKSLGQKG